MKNNKKKILFLIPSLVGGGAERTLINLLQKIDYLIYDVDLVVVSFNGIYINHVPKQVKLIVLFRNDFLVRVLAYLQKKIGLNSIFRKRIKSKLKSEYDVGISFLDGNFTDLLFFVPNIKKRVSWVHSSYKSNSNFYQFYQNKRYREKLINKRYGKLDEIVFVSQDARDEFIEIFGTFPNMKVIYNLIDSQIVTLKSQAEILEKTQKFQFIALGSLLPVKGFDRLIRAAVIVKKKGYDFHLKIAGTGAEKLALNNMIKENSIQDSINLIGFLPNPYPTLKNSDIFIMSSISEALPTVLCEAMILGKPTLVTNCCGCRELVDHEQFGLMADQNDESLAEKMIQYITKPELILHYQQKSLERAKLFDDNRIIKEYYKVFNS